MAARVLLFDLDGTIWDAWPWYAALLEEAAGVLASGTMAALKAGRSVVSLARGVGVSRQRFRALCEEHARDLPLYPGAVDTLGLMDHRGQALGVVTNLPEWLASTMLRGSGIAPRFESAVYWGTVPNRKPHPAPILEALVRISEEPGPDVFYVGDVPTDAKAATGAGISFAWASYGYGGAEPPGTDVVLTEFAETARL
jgi:phosphoglycolate phosphatase-like HAD superfamily hydrolase